MVNTALPERQCKRVTARIEAAIAFLAVILIPTAASACSQVACLDNGFEMRHAFVVAVMHEHKPLAGATVEITSASADDGMTIFSAKTEASGTVHVTNLPPGNYRLKVKLLNVYAGLDCFQVATKPSRKAKRKLRFEWGNLAPTTRRAAGKIVQWRPGTGGTLLQNQLHPIEVAIPGVALTLQTAVRGPVYRTVSDATGKFSFADVPAGTYVLRVEGGITENARTYNDADLILKISPRATANALTLVDRQGFGGACPGIVLNVVSTKR